MNDEKLKQVMEMFAGLNHGEQVEFFLAIKESLLAQRAERIEFHKRNQEYEVENVKALYAGNDAINANNVAIKANN